MADSPLDDGAPFFVGSPEQLQSLACWLDDFVRATCCRITDGDGSDEYTVDLQALNKVLASDSHGLGSLNPVDLEHCSRLIRQLQKEVVIILADGIDGLLQPSQELVEARGRLQRFLKFAVPHFQRLRLRIRDHELASTHSNNSNVNQAGPQDCVIDDTTVLAAAAETVETPIGATLTTNVIAGEQGSGENSNDDKPRDVPKIRRGRKLIDPDLDKMVEAHQATNPNINFRELAEKPDIALRLRDKPNKPFLIRKSQTRIRSKKAIARKRIQSKK